MWRVWQIEVIGTPNIIDPKKIEQITNARTHFDIGFFTQNIGNITAIFIFRELEQTSSGVGVAPVIETTIEGF
jgi:hypothetical protein